MFEGSEAPSLAVEALWVGGFLEEKWRIQFLWETLLIGTKDSSTGKAKESFLWSRFHRKMNIQSDFFFLSRGVGMWHGPE
jgi:hypothetical protein